MNSNFLCIIYHLYVATQSGLELLPFILGVVFAAITTGQLVSRTDRVSFKLLCIIGGMLIMVGSGLTSTFNETSTRGELTGYLLIGGIGVGKFFYQLPFFFFV